MTTRAEIEALIKMMGEAKEGSREFDYSIRMVLAGFAPVSAQAAAYSDEYESFDHAPHYTTSVDAALSLWETPDLNHGWLRRGVNLFYSVLPGGKFAWRAIAWEWQDRASSIFGVGECRAHSSRPLSAVIAALRARLSSMKDDANG